MSGTSRTHELGLDSLTLVFVLTQIESAHDVELTSEETLALLDAADIAALARALARIITSRASRRAGERGAEGRPL